MRLMGPGGGRPGLHGRRHAPDRLLQQGARRAHVQTHETRPVGAEVEAAAEGDPAVGQEVCRRVVAEAERRVSGSRHKQLRTAIASLAKAWSGKNVTIGQAGIGKQLTDCFVTMADAMLLGIGLVYLVVVMASGAV
jgi:hypothetical protein